MTNTANHYEGITPEKLLSDLGQFIGTEEYYRYPFGLALLTEGVKYLADAAECHWLLDAIASYQPELITHSDRRLHDIQFWTLKVNADHSAVLTCQADSGEPPAIRQRIGYTNFPLSEIQIWVAGDANGKVAMLPSEY